MKWMILVVVVAAMTLWAMPTAVAGARANTYYTVICDGIAYESVDAHAVEQGGKRLAVSLFPRADCALAGPFTS